MRKEELQALIGYRLQRASESMEEARLMQNEDNRLFDLRQEGDYIDFVFLEAETVEPLAGATAEFIDTIQLLITSA